MPAEAIVLGVVIGTGYGLIAVGLVLAFRASRVLNLAQGAIGVVSAACVAYLVQRAHLPYGVALAGGVAAGALTGALLQTAVTQRLRDAPPLLVLVATLGAAQGLTFLAAALLGELPPATPLPRPGWFPVIEIGALELNQAYSALLILGPLAVLAIAVVLQRTTLGMALRAAADNPDAARTLGLAAPKLGALVWALAGALAGLVGPLVAAGSGFAGAQDLGPDLLLRALAAALLARMASLPLALGAGVAIGVVEQIALYHTTRAGTADLIVLAVIVVAVIARPQSAGRVSETGSWTAFARWRPLPAHVRAVGLVRFAGPALALAAAALAALAPLALGPGDEVLLLQVACFALVGLSAWIVAGLTGGLPLAQAAIAGLGATAYVHAGPPAVGIVAAVAAGAAAATIITLPAVRDRGLLLAVVSLAAALAISRSVLPSEWALGDGVSTPGAGTPATVYEIALVALVVATAGAAVLARSRSGLMMLGVRDNEPGARALGVAPWRTRLQAAAVAGALAGLAGALLALGSPSISPNGLPALRNIDVVAVAALGGLAIAVGPLLGALYVLAMPLFLHLPAAALAATSFGWLVLLLYCPSGLGGIAERLRNHAVRVLLRVAGRDPDAVPTPDDERAEPPRAAVPFAAPDAGRVVLAAEGLRLRYGAVTALDDVTFSIARGEILGVVGPNGAGKTSLLDVVCGFVAPDGGRVELARQDRVARSFQYSALFGTLTVRETLGIVADDPDELIARFGLTPLRDRRVRELSSGTRRVVELACLVARRPGVLALDEPSAGLAHAEIAPLAALLRHVRDTTGAAIVLVDHDLPFVLDLADRVLVLDGGRVLGIGTPGHAADLLARDRLAAART